MDAALSAEERAGDLLEKMSLEEKMGQVNCVFPFSGMMDLVRETIQKSHGIGQISTLDMRMCDSLEEAVAWQRDLQKTAMEASEHHIPAVFHMDLFRMRSVFRAELQEDRLGIRSWSGKLRRLSEKKRRHAALHRPLHQCSISAAIPEWDVREKRMVKIRLWRLRWE